MTDGKKLPLDGIRVLDFTHNVMGPTTGMLMATRSARYLVDRQRPSATDHAVSRGALGARTHRQSSHSVSVVSAANAPSTATSAP